MVPPRLHGPVTVMNSSEKKRLETLPGRHKHEIAKPFVAGHMDGRIGRDLFELEPLRCLYHLRAHGPIEPLCFQCGRVVGEHFQKRGGEHRVARSAIVEDGFGSTRCQSRPDFSVPKFPEQTLATLIDGFWSYVAQSGAGQLACKAGIGYHQHLLRRNQLQQIGNRRKLDPLRVVL